MKKILALLSLSTCLLLFHACSREIDDQPAEKVQPERLANLSYYEDDYPEWGTTGTNWPAQYVSDTYSPQPELYRTIRIQNSLYPLGSSIYSLTPYIHVQWRKVNPNGSPAGRWYNYHPTIQEYTPLRLDTIPGVFLPSSIYWEINLNSIIMPKGDIQVRARMLLSPFTTTDRESATLWGNTYSFDNYFGYTEGSGPGTGQQVTVNINADVEAMIYNPYNRYYDYLEFTALGTTQTFYPNSSMSGLISMRALGTTKVTLEQSTIHNYTATVSAFLANGTKIASKSTTFSNIIYINSSMGSSPTVHFSDYMEFVVPGL